MRPIVDGLEEEYGAQMAFMRFNAQDNAEGEAFFQRLDLPGHPGFVLYSADHTLVYRGIGIVEETTFRDEINSVLDGR